MNFLAHAHLSGNNEELLFGNFIADSVKGKQVELFTPVIKQGILLHRMIDQYTDQHAVVKNSVQLVKPEMGRFSGVVVDIFFDHFLSLNWHDYSDIDLTEYSLWVYQILAGRYEQLPARNKRILPWMVAQNWLVSYASPHALKRVFYGMNRRTGNRSPMQNAVEVLLKNYEALHRDFRLFYPELQGFVSQRMIDVSSEPIA